jgi:hypothetical protein
MKYLNRFYNYIKESKDIDIDEVNHFLLPITDLGFTTNLRSGTLVDLDGGEYNGRRYLAIHITLDGLKTANLITTYNGKYIDDSNFWELLGEISSIRGRLIDSGVVADCLIDFSNKRGGYMPYISITLVGEKDDSDSIKLIELERRISSKLNSMKSDFSYGTYCRLYDDHIYIKSDSFGYTDRKLNNLINRSIEGSELSISDFNIEKNQNSETGDWGIKITIKK